MGPTENDQPNAGTPMPADDGSGAAPMPPAGGVVTPQPGADQGAAPNGAGAGDAFVPPEIKPEDVGLGDEPAATSEAPTAPADPNAPAADSASTWPPTPSDPNSTPGAAPQQ